MSSPHNSDRDQISSVQEKSLFHLNQDVLQEIASLLGARDLLQLGRTSRTAYTLVLPALLSHVLVALWKPPNAHPSEFPVRKDPSTFGPHMLAAPARILYLRSLALHFSADTISDETATQLRDVLAQASGLKDIDVRAMKSRRGWQVFGILSSAMKQLTSLRTISLGYADPRVFLLLDELPSSVLTVHLTFTSLDCDLPKPRAEFVAVALSRCKRSIRSLSVGGRMYDVLLELVRAGTVFPLVHTLSLCDDFDLTRLSHIFPSVRRFTLKHQSSHRHTTSTSLGGALVPAFNWRRLDMLETSIKGSYLCSARSVRTDAGPAEVHEILRNTKPASLHWKTTPSIGQLSALDDLCKFVTSLRYIELDFNHVKTQMTPYSWMLQLVAAFKSQPLVGIVVHYYVLPRGIARYHDMQQPPPYSMDTIQLSQAIAHTVPQARLIGITDPDTHDRSLLLWHQVTSREKGLTSVLRGLKPDEGIDVERMLLDLESEEGEL